MNLSQYFGCLLSLEKDLGDKLVGLVFDFSFFLKI